MDYGFVSVVLNILQILVLTVIAVLTVLRLRRIKASVILVFYLYGIVCTILSDFYWLAMDIMLPEKRIRFGVNEIAEAGLFLLFASTVNIVFRCEYNKKKIYPEVFAAVVYSAGIVCLWIGWTSEWVKDILSGLALGFLICSTVRLLKASQALKKAEWVVLGTGAFMLLILQELIFAVPAYVGKILDIICYVIMFGWMLWMVVRALYSMTKAHRSRKREECIQAFSLAMTSFLCAINTMYMSGEPMYNPAYIISTCTFLMLMFAVFSVDRSVYGREGA